MKRTPFTIHNSWLWSAVLLLFLLVLLAAGRWRSTGAPAQVQAPMFYDAHYLFPRPWTQMQAAPGVPAPFPLAFYGANSVSQPFISGANNLEMVEIWLAGQADTAVTATLAMEGGETYAAQIPLTGGEAGAYYRLSFPRLANAAGRTFWLTLVAPAATADRPLVTRAVGGDRLGGAIRLNEYPRPGNLQLYSYVSGTAVPAALLEQLLPERFRLRLQQYKAVKGEWFTILLVSTAALTLLFLALARPAEYTASQAVGWITTGLLLGLLVWQVGGGRVRLPSGSETMLEICDGAQTSRCQTFATANETRVVNDMILTLWTSRREPEERFITTTMINGRPAILTPADSLVGYALDVPRHGRFQTTAQAVGSGDIRFTVLFREEMLAEQLVSGGGRPYSFDIDLSALAGQSGELRLVTEAINGAAAGYWQQPQLLAQTDWLLAKLPPQAIQAGHRIGETVELVAYTAAPGAADTLLVTLYWRMTRPSGEPAAASDATVFVHLLDESGNLIAQHDGIPVQNSYPLAIWPPGVLIADEHSLPWSGEPFTLAIGLYNAGDLSRWPVTNPNGIPDPDGRALLPGREPLP